MLESIIQIIVVVGFSVFLRVFAKEQFGDSNASDKKPLNQCSFEANEEVIINLCTLEGNVILNVSQRTSAGGNSPSIKIHRYYWINPFGRIQIAKVPDLSSTNCPINSTSCLVSEVTFQCKDNQDGDGVCFNDQQITADSYGMLENWTPKTVYPPVSSNGNVKGSTASITMYGRPCYYCSDSDLNLSTVIGFYCDERITGKGKPIIKQQPTKHNPEVLLHWNTSAACYEFIKNEKCTFPDFFETFCNDNAFGCNSSQVHKNHQYSFPSSKNSSLSFVSSSITYTFGFCARDVECNTTDDKNVMICKKEGQDLKPLAYYNDNVEFIARPTGFVMRIKEQSGDSVKAVISFECLSTDDISLTSVLEEDNLPILLIIRHSCFCPNMSDSSQATEAPPMKATSAPSRSTDHKFIRVIISVVSSMCVLVAILIYVKHKSRTRTRTEEPPPNNGRDLYGDFLLNNKSPPNTYDSCKTMFCSLTAASNEAHIDESKQMK